ncbi:hypothetical protein R5R35_012914 [Gryllus longicercus]|uniref:Formiminotransferase N-terminal subdomain domain-containing protein n=1 Tax=Gryllus longicercus TaxID=2509291 RepID=A0AAN9V3T6_9ORTH
MPQREDEKEPREVAEEGVEEGAEEEEEGEDADDGCDDVQELLARDDAVIECVPNISEGRDAQVVEAVAAAARGVAGCTLLDVSSGADTHRTVLTLAGAPAAVLAAAQALAAAAAARIDMRRHAGAHPRLGALDVCPLVPVRGLSLRQCALLARELARRIAEALDVPVYLYGAAVAPGPERDHRRTAPQIRAGEYEGLAKKVSARSLAAAAPTTTPLFRAPPQMARSAEMGKLL